MSAPRAFADAALFGPVMLLSAADSDLPGYFRAGLAIAGTVTILSAVRQLLEGGHLEGLGGPARGSVSGTMPARARLGR